MRLRVAAHHLAEHCQNSVGRKVESSVPARAIGVGRTHHSRSFDGSPIEDVLEPLDARARECRHTGIVPRVRALTILVRHRERDDAVPQRHRGALEHAQRQCRGEPDHVLHAGKPEANRFARVRSQRLGQYALRLRFDDAATSLPIRVFEELARWTPVRVAVVEPANWVANRVRNLHGAKSGGVEHCAMLGP